jgi:hypothetical protein
MYFTNNDVGNTFPFLVKFPPIGTNIESIIVFISTLKKNRTDIYKNISRNEGINRSIDDALIGLKRLTLFLLYFVLFCEESPSVPRNSVIYNNT